MRRRVIIFNQNIPKLTMLYNHCFKYPFIDALNIYWTPL